MNVNGIGFLLRSKSKRWGEHVTKEYTPYSGTRSRSRQLHVPLCPSSRSIFIFLTLN
ncbi:hypothetical protein K449DRAFT_147762 [Hypoxylon sp. EC38]|nr:hypothetical protein K449DRAFT_147762 [Hypoxylon sp. EC38]